jgi:NAD(P)-dependent dehydrogenase (short-subunit alcohol dehydrogenase family)
MTGKFPFIENEFIGKRALVTSGTAGIGQAVLTAFLTAGPKW